MIELELSLVRNPTGIHQDLVDRYGFTSNYQSVQRFVRKLRGAVSPEARVIIEPNSVRQNRSIFKLAKTLVHNYARIFRLKFVHDMTAPQAGSEIRRVD